MLNVVKKIEAIKPLLSYDTLVVNETSKIIRGLLRFYNDVLFSPYDYQINSHRDSYLYNTLKSIKSSYTIVVFYSRLECCNLHLSINITLLIKLVHLRYNMYSYYICVLSVHKRNQILSEIKNIASFLINKCRY